MMIYTKIPKSRTKLRPKKEREEYEAWLAKHKAATQKKKSTDWTSEWSYSLTKPVSHRQTERIPSLNTGMGWAPAQNRKVYTGTKMIGIGTLHKSNAVPVFTEEEAHDMAKMRR